MRKLIALCCIVLFSSEFPALGQEMKEYHLDEVTVISSRRNTDVFSSPDAVTVIDSTVIAGKNARNLPDALSFEGHVLMQKTNLGGGSPFIRGMTGKDVLLLIDGIRYNNATFRYGPNQYMNLIDPAMVDRVEVVRGPGSVMYGSDALGGVVNIITHRPSADDNRRLYSTFTSRYASQDEGTMNRLDLGGKLGFLRLSGGITVNKYSDLKGGDSVGNQPYTGYDQQSWNVNAVSRLGRGTVTISGGKTEQDDVPRTDKFLYKNTSYMFDPQSYQFLNASYDIAKPFRGVSSFHLALSSMRQEEGIDQYKLDSSLHKRNHDETDTRGLTAHAVSTIAGKHVLVYGIDYADDKVSSDAHTLDTADGTVGVRLSNYPDGSTFTAFGAFLEDRFKLSDRAAVTAGIRWSDFRTESNLPDYGTFKDTVSDFTWSGALSYKISDTRRANFKVSRGFRAPNLDDSVVLGRETGVGVDIPSPGLDPVTVTDYEIVLKAKTDRFDEEIAVYYMDYDGLIERAEGMWQGSSYVDANKNNVFDDGDEVYWKKVNVGKATVWGIEHSLFGRYGDYLVRESVTYTRGTDRDNDEPLRRIPPLRILLGVGRPISEKTDTELIMRYSAKQDRLSPGDISDPRIPDGGTPGYTVYDLRFTYRMNPNATLNLVFENLTDKTYKEHGSGVWGPGRGISAGLTLRN